MNISSRVLHDEAHVVAASSSTRDLISAESFSTRSTRREDQFEAWSEWFRPVFDITPTRPPRGGFLAENVVWRLGGVAVSQVSGPPLRSERKLANIRREPADHWVVTYCRKGSSRFLANTEQIEAPIATPFIWSMGEPSLCERTEIDRIQLILTRDAFRTLAPLLDGACGSVLSSPLGQLLGDYVVALEQRLPTLTRADLPRLAGAVGAMVAAAIEPSPNRTMQARRQIDLGRLERVRRTVRQHLRAPALGPATLCRSVGVSRSNLYRLLENVGGIARYIQAQRLSEAHAVLADPRNRKPISAVADELCFADASTFSRAFKREFGYSPSEIVGAAPGGIIPTPLKNHSSTESFDFSDLLRDF